MRRFGKQLQRLPGSAVATQTREETIRAGEADVPELFASILGGTKPRGVTSEDRTVEGIPIRIYRPDGATDASAGAKRPLIVYFHGGGFVFGNLRGGDWICGSVSQGAWLLVRLPARPLPVRAPRGRCSQRFQGMIGVAPGRAPTTGRACR